MRILLAGALLAPLCAGAAEPAMTLEQAFALASARSDNVRIAEVGVLQADLSLSASWVPIAPTATVTATVSTQTPEFVPTPAADPTTPVPNYGQLVQVSPIVTQPIFRKGFFSGREAGQQNVESAAATLARTREQLFMDVVTDYIAVLRARQQRVVAQAAVERATAEEESAVARVQAGGALKTAQLQASIDRRRAELQLISAQRLLEEQEVIFERLVGKKPPELKLPATPPVPTPDKALTIASERSDLVARHAARLASEATEDVLTGKLWPTLDAVFRYDYFYAPPGIAIANPGAYRAFALLTVPLFDLNTQVNFRNQRLLTESAEFQEELLRKQVTEDVRTAQVDLFRAKQATEVADQQVKDARDNYAMVSNQFKLKVVSFIEVTAAQAALTEAEDQAVVARYDYELAAYRLLFAAGQLLPK